MTAEPLPAAEPDQYDERRAFLERRATCIGATDAAAILGLSPWANQLSVYHDKVDPVEVREPSLPAWLGLKMQATVAELYAAQVGVRLRADNRHHVHPVYTWLGCHLDYRVLGQPKRLVEIKTTGSRRGWGEPGSENVPVWYYCQAQHEMLVTGAEQCDIAVLFGNYAFAVYPITRNAEFLDKYLAATDHFWHTHIEPRVEPPLDGSEYAAHLLKRRYPRPTTGLKSTVPEQDEVVKRLRRGVANQAQVVAYVEALKNRIKEIIGEAEGLVGPWGRITWRKDRDREVVNWEAVAKAYRMMIEETYVKFIPGTWQPDGLPPFRVTERDRVDLDAIQSIHTNTIEGGRRFAMRWADEEESSDDA